MDFEDDYTGPRLPRGGYDDFDQAFGCLIAFLVMGFIAGILAMIIF